MKFANASPVTVMRRIRGPTSTTSAIESRCVLAVGSSVTRTILPGHARLAEIQPSPDNTALTVAGGTAAV